MAYAFPALFCFFVVFGDFCFGKELMLNLAINYLPNNRDNQAFFRGKFL